MRPEGRGSCCRFISIPTELNLSTGSGPSTMVRSSEKGNAVVVVLVLAVLAGIVTLWAPSCAGVSPPEERAVAIAMPIEPSALNPVLELNNEARQVVSLVFDGLTNPVGLTGDLRQEYVNALAENIRETNPQDRRFLAVDLKPGIKWHDGSNFTAADVLFTWEAIHQSNSPVRVRLDRFIDDIRVQGERTIEVRLREERISERVADLLSFKVIPQSFQADGVQGSLPKNLRAQSALVNQFNWKPVGTGPYQISARPSASEIQLSANPLPVLGAPRTKHVQLKRYPGWDVIAKGLSDDSVSLAVDVPPEYFAQLDQLTLSKQAYSPYNFYAMVYNVTRPPLNDVAFRRALAHATDRTQLAAAFLPNEPDVRPFLNESIYPHNFEHVKSDPKGYRSAIAYDSGASPEQAGATPPATRKVTLLYCSYLNGENANQLARAYQQMLAQIGVEVVLENAPNIASYYANLQNRRFQIALVLFDRLDHFYDLYDIFEPDAARNYAGFNNTKLTDKLAELKLTLRYEDTARITRDIHQIIDEQVPVTPLFTLPRRAYYSGNLLGLTINPETYLDLLFLAGFK